MSKSAKIFQNQNISSGDKISSRDKNIKHTSKPELLLPAGNMVNLKAAVENGADAVYLGMKKFNAREFAENFTEQELKEAIKYCHSNGVKVYVAFNTLLKDKEIKEWLENINLAYSFGCDAIIIQDYWLLPLLNKNFPDLEIHLSTQAFLMNFASIEYISKIGKFSRIILPRELSYQDIKNIKENIDKKGLKIDLEMFCHGALCVSYSGQCLFSSIIGGRSGNRGKCAQPCRRKYNNEYLLSTKDLCLINHLDKILDLGIKALKIEGRMRSELYVKVTARNYRKALDELYDQGTYHISEEQIKELELGFNRSFTEGFFTGKSNPEIISSEKPMNRGIFLGEYENGLIKLNYPIRKGDGYSVWGVGDEENKGGIITKILKQSKDVDYAEKGDIVDLGFNFTEKRKIYLTSSVDINNKYNINTNNLNKNPSEINYSYLNSRISVSRSSKSAKSEYNSEYKSNNEFNFRKNKIIVAERKKSELVLPTLKSIKNKFSNIIAVNVKDISEAEQALKENPDIISVDIIYKDIVKIQNLCKEHNSKINSNKKNVDNTNHINHIKNLNNTKFFIRTRQFVNDSQILEDIQKIKALMPDGLLILNIGYLNYLNSNEFSILLNYNLNIFNSYSFNELRNHNLNAILSVELNFDEMTQIKDKNYFVFIHGQLPVSYIKADVPVGYIEDEKHFMFKIEEYPSNLNNNERNITKNNDKYKILFNSKELGFFENVKKLNENGIKNYFIDTRRNISSVVKYYREILFGKSVQNNFYYNKKEFTTGHLKRGVE